MKTVQVVMDAKLLKAVDIAAKRQKVNRSAFLRDAAEDKLKLLRIRELEERDRRAYALIPDDPDEALPMEMLAWPD